MKWLLLRKLKQLITKLSKNKAQYNWHRNTAKVFALSSGNDSKYEFLTDKDVLPEKELLGKVFTMKRF